MNTFTISEVANKIGVTAPTLRYYDKEGLLPFVDRTESGIRLFKESDLVWLKLIGCLKATGLPIKGIKQYIDWYMEGNVTLEKRRDMFYERKEIVENQIKELKQTLEMIDYKCWYYDIAVEANDEDAAKMISNENIPEKIRDFKKRMDF